MADIEVAFTAYLKAYAGLVALVATRIYPDELPQGATLPAVTYINVSDVKQHTLTGQLKQERPMYQFTAHATTRAAARSVASQIKLALCDYQGTIGGLYIQKIELENEMTTLERSNDGTIRTYMTDLEFQIIYVNA